MTHARGASEAQPDRQEIVYTRIGPFRVLRDMFTSVGAKARAAGAGGELAVPLLGAEAQVLADDGAGAARAQERSDDSHFDACVFCRGVFDDVEVRATGSRARPRVSSCERTRTRAHGGESQELVELNSTGVVGHITCAMLYYFSNRQRLRPGMFNEDVMQVFEAMSIDTKNPFEAVMLCRRHLQALPAGHDGPASDTDLA